MTNKQTIIRTRNQQRAHEIARRMAGMVQRTFAVTRRGTTLWEVHPQRQDLDPKIIKGYIRVAQALKRLDDN